MSKRWLGLLLLLMVWVGRGGVAHAAVNASPDPLDVGSTNVGMPKSATGSLTNVTLVSVSLALRTGGDCSQFTITSATTMLSVGPSTSNNVTVRLTPATNGLKTCTIDVTDESDGTALGTLGVQGTGTGGAPAITVTTGPIDFMHVDVGSTGGTQTITATNTGTAPLMIMTVTLSANATSYQVTGTTGAQTIQPGNHFDWTVACKPQLRGSLDSAFQIASNAPTSPSSVALKCIGDQGALSVDVTTFDFGATLLNSTKMTTVVLSNVGNVDVTGVTGVFDKTMVGYSIDPTTPVPGTILAGGQAALTVKFAPTKVTDGGAAKITFNGTWHATHATNTVVTNLNGQTVSLDLSTTTLAFGNFRFDSMPSKTFSIINSGTAAVPIDSVTFVPDMGTDPTEVPFTLKVGGATVTLPTSLGAGAQLDVAVTAKPNNRAGLIGGKFVVHSSLTGLADQTVTMTGNATAAVINATAMVDFGAVDIDVAATAPPKMTVMIMNTNTGTANLDISAVTITSMAGTAGVFTFTNPLPTTTTSLAPNAALVIEANYKPTAERGPGDFDKIVLTATLTGALGGPSAQTITIQGRGIDRNLVIQDMPTFPPTFRNPGDMAPTRTIIVHNNGEAVLKITAAMITGEPVWQLMDKNPVDIAGATSHNFVVKFTPNAIGPAPMGQLTLTSNDDHNVTKMITLTGEGVGRNVALGPTTGVEPRTIDLGMTGAGISFTADDILAVTNMDSATAFTIHDIVLDDPKTFHLESPPADADLPASAKKLFAVTFDPKDVGDFTTMATLHLDQDPETQATVLITGHAVFVEAHGGGGCDAGGTGRGGGLVIGLAALGVIGRRRRSRAQRVAS